MLRDWIAVKFNLTWLSFPILRFQTTPQDDTTELLSKTSYQPLQDPGGQIQSKYNLFI